MWIFKAWKSDDRISIKFKEINDLNSMSIIPYITPRESKYLTHYNTGLGNALFQIASCYGLSKKYNIKIYYNYVIDYCNILKDRYGFNHCDTILRKCKHVLDSELILSIIETSGNNRNLDYGIINRIEEDLNNNYHIIGYLESVDYFIKYKDNIRDLFSADEYSLMIIKERYPILFSGIESVSIHFRFNECSYTFDNTYYREAIKLINMMLEHSTFLIFSDDKSKVNIEELGLKPVNTQFINLEYDYLDLWAMSFCKHHISSNSTFAFWGTFLSLNTKNKSIIISPKNLSVDWYSDSIKL
jgi:hypothetical protein